MTISRLAALDISRRPGASAMLIISIAISVAITSLLFRLFLISENRLSTLAHGGDAVIGAKSGDLDILLSSLNNEGGAPGFLPHKLFQSLRNHQSVQFGDSVTTKESFLRSVIPIVHFAKFRDYRAIGTDASFFERPHAEDSIHLAAGTLATNEREVVVGYRVAVNEGLKLGSDVELTRWVNDPTQNAAPENFKVVGIMKETKAAWDYNVFATVSEAQRVLGAQPLVNSIWENQIVTYVMVYLAPDSFDKLEHLVNNRSVGQTVSIKETTLKLRDLTGLAERLGNLIIAMILLLTAALICAVLFVRHGQLSAHAMILRSLGFQRSQIAMWIMLASLMAAVFGILIGAFVESAAFIVFHRALGAVVPAVGADAVSMLQLWPIWIATLSAAIIGTFLPMIRVSSRDTI